MSKNVAKLVFWGVRGSIPSSDYSTWRYGGNTPCVELETPEGNLLILDCGSGLRMLGNRLLRRRPNEHLEASIFLTHYHWDHLQGIPFFAPLYAAQNHFRFYSALSESLGPHGLQQALYAQMVSPFFPVNPEVLAAAREFVEITGGDQLEINGTRIRTEWLNHPQGCLGFRFETSSGTIVYATDNEPGVPELDRNLQRLARNADILIYDAQYTPEQLVGSRKGWGHSSWLEGVKVAEECGVRHLVLFHHDPDSTDTIVDGLLKQARERFDHVWAAAEGMRMTLDGGKLEISLDESLSASHGKVHLSASVTGVGDDAQSFVEEITAGELLMHGAQFHLNHRPRLQSEISVAVDWPRSNGGGAEHMLLRGLVVDRKARSETGDNIVTVVFTEKAD